jgi:hypothetical protein
MELISYAALEMKLRQLLEAIRACARSMRGDASTHVASHALLAAKLGLVLLRLSH